MVRGRREGDSSWREGFERKVRGSEGREGIEEGIEAKKAMVLDRRGRSSGSREG